MDLTIFGKVVPETNPNPQTRMWFVRRYPFSLRIIIGSSGSHVEILDYFGNQVLHEADTPATNPTNIVSVIETQMKTVYSESSWYTT